MAKSAKMEDRAAIVLKVLLQRKYCNGIKMLLMVLGRSILRRLKDLMLVVSKIANTGKNFFIDDLVLSFN